MQNQWLSGVPDNRAEPLKTNQIWELSTGPDFFRPRPKQRRMTHKRRLVSARQGFVFVTFVTPNMLCAGFVDIGGFHEAGRQMAGPCAPRLFAGGPLTKSS